jgi:uncharacterized protein (TIGR02302 family)
MSLTRKGAFETHPVLARRVALKRSFARIVLTIERILPLLLLPVGIAALFLSAAWFGVFRFTPDWVRWILVGGFGLAFLFSLLPLTRIGWPSPAEADRLLEERNNLPHQPVAVQEDQPAFETPFSRALWNEHQIRMAERIAALDAGLPQPDIARYDRFALRAVPALVFVVALGYSFSNGGGSTADAFRPAPPAPSVNPDLRIDAWLTPPTYTGKAPVFLTGQQANANLRTLAVPQNSALTVRVTGGEGDEAVVFQPKQGGEAVTLVTEEAKKAAEAAAGQAQTASAPAAQPQAQPEQPENLPLAPRTYALNVAQSGSLSTNGQTWTFDIIPDRPPEIAFDGHPRRSVNGALEIGFTGKDDYGIREAHALIEPVGPVDEGAKPLYPLPEYRLDMPRQNGREVKGLTSRSLIEHPLAGKRVKVTLVAKDGAGQTGMSPSHEMILPARGFSEPLAAAVAEQRQVFALDTRQLPRSIALNEALALRPDETIPNLSHFLLIRSALGRMELARNEEQLKQTADYLWEIALGIEDGELSAAERRLRDAQRNLSEALERNASDQEIAQLMKELREAMQQFMNELAQRMQNAPQAPNNMQAQNVIRQRDLQNMMDQIENLARSGNRDAAQQMLNDLQRMMNNLQAGRPQRQQQGQQQNSQMRQQIDKLGEIMQEQQRLMDQTFKLDQALRDRMQRGDPQEGEQGQQQQGQQQQGQQQQGQQQQGQQQQGQQQQGQQQQGQQQQGQQNTDQMTAEQLREALKNLRAQQEGLGKKLDELQKGLKELGMQPGEGFGKAQSEMGNAGKALGEGQGEQAVQGQGNALNALRQGAQNMMQQMMQAMQGQGQQPGQGRDGQGENMASQGGQNGRDPLGRPRSTTGPDFGDQVKVPDEIDVQRAREILEAIREKLGNALSGEAERQYLERLLEIR